MSEIDISKCKRGGFMACYYNAGSFAEFKGQVVAIKGSDKYCFKRIYISYTAYDGVCEEQVEDHVWIYSKEFDKKKIAIGDCVAFWDEIKPYKRRNGTYELGIVNPQDIEKIESYDLPSKEELFRQELRSLKCELCIMHEQCDGFNCFL